MSKLLAALTLALSSNAFAFESNCQINVFQYCFPGAVQTESIAVNFISLNACTEKAQSVLNEAQKDSEASNRAPAYEKCGSHFVTYKFTSGSKVFKGVIEAQ